MRKCVFILLSLLICPLLVAQQAMNDDSVVKLVKAGLSDDIVVATINASLGNYNISTDSLIGLKTAGVNDKVIAAIVAKASAALASTAPPQGLAVQPSNTNGAGPSSDPIPQPAADPVDTGTVTASGTVPVGSRLVIAPMGGFETYFAAAVREKKVPIILTLDKASAQYFVVSTNTEWQGFVFGSGGAASWTRAGGSAAYGASASSTRGLEASIMLINARTKDVVWAYEVHKSSHGSLLFGTLGARGQQSIAEACAKHLKEYVEKGK